MESLNFYTSSIRDERYCGKSGTNGVKKKNLLYCSNQAWLKNGGLILGSAIAIVRNGQDLLADGRTPYEMQLGEPFKGPKIPFGAMVDLSSYFTERACENSSFWQEGFSRNLSGL